MKALVVQGPAFAPALHFNSHRRADARSNLRPVPISARGISSSWAAPICHSSQFARRPVFTRPVRRCRCRALATGGSEGEGGQDMEDEDEDGSVIADNTVVPPPVEAVVDEVVDGATGRVVRRAGRGWTRRARLAAATLIGCAGMALSPLLPQPSRAGAPPKQPPAATAVAPETTRAPVMANSAAALYAGDGTTARTQGDKLMEELKSFKMDLKKGMRSVWVGGASTGRQMNVAGGQTVTDALAIQKELEASTLSEQFGYRLELLLTASPGSKFTIFIACSAVVIVVGGYAYWRVDGKPTLGQALYDSYCFVVATPGADAFTITDPKPQFVAQILCFFGLLFFGLFIGLITDGISVKVADLQSGKSRVLETNHTLVLGWNSRTVALLRQLCISQQSEDGGGWQSTFKRPHSIVVLADKEKEDMESEISEGIAPWEIGRVSVVCRQGNPSASLSHRLVSGSQASSIVIMSDENEEEEAAAADALKMLLRVRKTNPNASVVVEENTNSLGGLVKLASGDLNVTHVDWQKLLGRHLVQCARSPPGHNTVIMDLMGFEGSEFYHSRFPALEGYTWDAVCRSFSDAVPVGLLREGKTMLNPKPVEMLRSDDEVLVIAEDEHSYRRAKTVPTPERGRMGIPRQEKKMEPESYLILGYRDGLADMINVLDGIVHPRSRAVVMADMDADKMYKALVEDGLQKKMKHLNVTCVRGSALDREDIFNAGFLDSRRILVLLDNSHVDPHGRQGRTLANLLHMSQLAQEHNKHNNFEVCLEIEERSMEGLVQEAAKLAAKEWVRTPHPNNLVANLMALTVKDPVNLLLWEELLDSEGCEIYLTDIADYLYEGEVSMSFHELSARCRAVGETLIGWQNSSDNRQDTQEISINPADKSQQIEFTPNHRLIIITDEM